MLRRIVHIFYMPQWKSSRVLFKYFIWIMTGLSNPIKIELHFYKIFIGIFKQHMIRQLAVLLCEFKIMIMVTELNVGFFACFCCLIKMFRKLFVMINVATFLGE